MTSLRFRLLLGAAFIAAAGCASQPQTTERNTAGAGSPAPVPTAAPATSASAAASIQAMKHAVPPELLVFAHDQGYTQVVIKGDNYSFCKTEAEIGELIPTRQCVDRTQLESLRIQVEQQKQQLGQRGAETTGASGP